MRRAHRRLRLGLFTLLVLVAAAGVWWLFFPQPGPLKLSRAEFADLPGWGASDQGPALAAFQRSCAVLMAKPDTTPMGRYGGSIADWRGACAAAAITPPAAARDFFEHWFTPVAVRAGRVDQGRFTGYYEPEIAGRRLRQGRFQTPVYGKPDDLVEVDLGSFRPALAGEHLSGHVVAGKLVAYPPRAEIVAQGLNAPVLFYTDDPIALFILHIQGSGRVRFGDGSLARVAYAGQNGQPYTAIGKILIARGVPKDGMSMQVIRDWLKAHPSEADAVMNGDASYVFFSEDKLGDPALGAKGAEGVALTATASLAVDPREHALGTPFFVAGPAPLGRLLIAQDIGGAIRGVIRGDVYFGHGEAAEAAAGSMNQIGRFYALLPKPVVAHLAAAGTLP